MAIKMNPYVRQVVRGTAESHSLTLLKTRDLVDVSDEPPERGGTKLETIWKINRTAEK